MQLSLKILLPVAPGGVGPGYTCLSISSHLADGHVNLQVFMPVWRALTRPAWLNLGLPRLAAVLPYRWIRPFAVQTTEQKFLNSISPGDVVYLWSECSLELAYALRRRGIPVIREKFNTHKATALQILDEAYIRVGLKPTHGLTRERIEKESEELNIADYVFSPSSMVTRSLLENGVRIEQILESSYGWEPKRLAIKECRTRRHDGLTVLFVGTVCIRKGAHLLLQAWCKSRIRGHLLLAGSVETALAERYSDLLNRTDVVALGFVRDVASLYASADLFAFPSIEEGDPLVTYEAMACGLPSIVSPMGAGRGVQDQKQGFVIDPYNIEAWTNALIQLAGSEELRKSFRCAAQSRAQLFTWERVGASRRKLILARFGDQNYLNQSVR